MTNVFWVKFWQCSSFDGIASGLVALYYCPKLFSLKINNTLFIGSFHYCLTVLHLLTFTMFYGLSQSPTCCPVNSSHFCLMMRGVYHCVFIIRWYSQCICGSVLSSWFFSLFVSPTVLTFTVSLSLLLVSCLMAVNVSQVEGVYHGVSIIQWHWYCVCSWLLSSRFFSLFGSLTVLIFTVSQVVSRLMAAD